MKSVKVLPKGQITLPRDIRKKLEIKTGDMPLLEEKDRQVVLKRKDDLRLHRAPARSEDVY